jgi:LCP family protein required for cell wall assembly
VFHRSVTIAGYNLLKVVIIFERRSDMGKKWLFIVAFISLLAACGIRTQFQPANQAVSILITPDSNGTATLTPFQPIAPTPTQAFTSTPTPIPPTPTPDVTSTPTATSTPTTTPSPTPPVLPEGVVNILLIGTDWRPQSGGRSDVIILISISQKTNTVRIVSFPRDLYVNIPGRGLNRINAAVAYGGFPLLKETLATNFWIRPEYYVSTNMEGFVRIVNTLGGIEVNAARHLTDRCDLPQAVDGSCTVTPGWHLMDGETALWYVRSRMPSNDFDRLRRAQEVLLALFNKLLRVNAVVRAPELYRQFQNTVETNMPLDEMLKLVPVIVHLNDPARIERYTIGPAETWDFRTETGARVLLPNYEAIWPILQRAVFSE